MENISNTVSITDETIESIVKEARITIEDNIANIFYENEIYLLEAASNFNNGNIDVDMWENDDLIELTAAQKEIIWEQVEKERGNNEPYEEPYFYLTHNK